MNTERQELPGSQCYLNRCKLFQAHTQNCALNLESVGSIWKCIHVIIDTLKVLKTNINYITWDT